MHETTGLATASSLDRKCAKAASERQSKRRDTSKACSRCGLGVTYHAHIHDQICGYKDVEERQPQSSEGVLIKVCRKHAQATCTPNKQSPKISNRVCCGHVSTAGALGGLKCYVYSGRANVAKVQCMWTCAYATLVYRLRSYIRSAHVARSLVQHALIKLGDSGEWTNMPRRCPISGCALGCCS
jgi:hypothetical protein